jgi:hypothetical protein
MQLYATDIDRAIAELQQAIPIAALSNIIDRRVAQHKARGELRRWLELLRAIQLAEEARQ